MRKKSDTFNIEPSFFFYSFHIYNQKNISNYCINISFDLYKACINFCYLKHGRLFHFILPIHLIINCKIIIFQKQLCIIIYYHKIIAFVETLVDF